MVGTCCHGDMNQLKEVKTIIYKISPRISKNQELDKKLAL